MDIGDKKIGIIGCGHLGLSLAQKFSESDLVDKEQLFLSHNGKRETFLNIKQANLSSRIFTNEKIAKESDVIILSVKPQDIPSISIKSYKKNTPVLSFIAGACEEYLSQSLCCNVVRGIISGPDTIYSNNSVIAFTKNPGELMSFVLCQMAKIFCILPERHIDLLSSLLTLPALLLIAESRGREKEVFQAIDEVEARYSSKHISPRKIFSWALELKPSFSKEADLKRYVSEMATEGGVTEAVIHEFVEGGTILSSIDKGVEKSRLIGESISIFT